MSITKQHIQKLQSVCLWSTLSLFAIRIITFCCFAYVGYTHFFLGQGITATQLGIILVCTSTYQITSYIKFNSGNELVKALLDLSVS